MDALRQLRCDHFVSGDCRDSPPNVRIDRVCNELQRAIGEHQVSGRRAEMPRVVGKRCRAPVPTIGERLTSTDCDIEVDRAARHVCNAEGLLNPQKILPSARGCKEVLTPKFPGVIEGVRA